MHPHAEAGEDTISARGSTLASVVVAGFMLAGCASTALLEVEERRFAAPFVGRADRAAQVERAGAGLGWQTVRVAPGRIRASSDAAGKGLVVTILFDAATFSIRYEDSREPAAEEVVSDRNVAVARLRDAILAQSRV